MRKAIFHQVCLQLCLDWVMSEPQVCVFVAVSWYLHQDLVAEYLFVVPAPGELGSLHVHQVENPLLLLSQFLFINETD